MDVPLPLETYALHRVRGFVQPLFGSDLMVLGFSVGVFLFIFHAVVAMF